MSWGQCFVAPLCDIVNTYSCKTETAKIGYKSRHKRGNVMSMCRGKHATESYQCCTSRNEAQRPTTAPATKQHRGSISGFD